MCCKVLKISELEKPGNVWCRHCSIGVGCTIYETRPEPCRVYECLWLKSQRLEKPIALELRPDKSRVVIGTANNGEDVILYLDPDRPGAWEKGRFGKLIADWRARGINVFTSCNDVVEKI